MRGAMNTGKNKVLRKIDRKKHHDNYDNLRNSSSFPLGELASIAHEIKQPLATIHNYASGCINRFETNSFNVSEMMEVMRSILKQVNIMGKIVHHMENIVNQQ